MDEPFAIADSINVLAGSIPPITSITMSAPDAARPAASSVRSLESTPGRGFEASRTAIPVNLSSRPIRAVKSSALSEISWATDAPTVPPPSNATVSGELIFFSLFTSGINCRY